MSLWLGLGASGCVSGHLLDAARRWERPQAIAAASLDGERLRLRYRTVVTDDADRPCGHGAGRAAVALAALRPPGVPVERLRVERPAEGGPLAGEPVPLVAPEAQEPPLRLAVVPGEGGAPALLALHAPAGDYAPLPASALARSWIAPWAYPLLPVTLAVDAVGTPLLLFFAPAVIVVGD